VAFFFTCGSWLGIREPRSLRRSLKCFSIRLSLLLIDVLYLHWNCLEAARGFQRANWHRGVLPHHGLTSSALECVNWRNIPITLIGRSPTVHRGTTQSQPLRHPVLRRCSGLIAMRQPVYLALSMLRLKTRLSSEIKANNYAPKDMPRSRDPRSGPFFVCEPVTNPPNACMSPM